MSKVTLQSVATVDNSLINAVNNNNTTIIAAFDNTISRDGIIPNQMKSTLDMNSNPIINIPFASQPNEPVALAQINPNTNFAPTLSGDLSVGAFNGSSYPATIQPGVVTGSKTATNTIANSNLTQMVANTVKGNPTGSTANVQDVSAQTARGSTLLNIESVTAIGDASYTILPTDRFLTTFVAFTAPRTFTLPFSQAANPGQRLIIVSNGSQSVTNTLTITKNASDSWIYINAGNGFPNSITISTANAFTLEFVNLGISGWVLVNNNTFLINQPGQVPPSGGGTTNFLRADGVWTNVGTPTVQRFTTGSATYTPTSGTIYIRVRMVGGGGGGGAAITNNGSTGGTTTFGSWTAVGGTGGVANVAAGVPTTGGTGGATGTGTLINRSPGGAGAGSVLATGGANILAGIGGDSLLGLGGRYQQGGSGSAGTNYGGGGCGGASGSSGGAGGGGGEYVEFFVNSPIGTAYTVGGAGTAGAAGGIAGSAGAGGIIIIEEYPF